MSREGLERLVWEGSGGGDKFKKREVTVEDR